MVTGVGNLGAAVEELLDGAEGIAAHLIEAAGPLQMQCADDPGIRDSASGAAPARDEEEGDEWREKGTGERAHR
jgi:hypothetical protein